MKIIAGGFPWWGRLCDAWHQNQTPRDNSICCNHRQKIVRLRVDWWDSWRRGPPDNQQRRLWCRFLMPSTTPRLLPRPKHTRLGERGYTPRIHNVDGATAPQNRGGRGRSPTAYAQVIQLWGSRQCCATWGGCGYPRICGGRCCWGDGVDKDSLCLGLSSISFSFSLFDDGTWAHSTRPCPPPIRKPPPR